MSRFVISIIQFILFSSSNISEYFYITTSNKLFQEKRTTISNDTPIPFNFLELVAYILSAGCTLHRHVNCGNPLFSVCVPTPDINYHRNIKVVFEVLISHFFTLRSEHEMLRKVPKIKDFYEFFFCINTIVSTCCVPGNISTQHPFSTRYPYS